MTTDGGDVEINRPDGLLARFTTPNSPDRPVALKRRELHELLDEELRRLDPDDVYEETLDALRKLHASSKSRATKTPAKRSPTKRSAKKAAHKQSQSRPKKRASR
jgi:hypothetical protein